MNTRTRHDLDGVWQFTLTDTITPTPITPKPQAAQPSPSPSPAERPAHIPEKFWDAQTGTARVDDMAKAYGELEQKLGKPEQTQAPEAKTEGDLGIQKPEEPQGFVLTKDNVLSPEARDLYTKEIAELGSLSENSYAKLREGGITREIADEYIAATVAAGKAQAASFQSQVHAAVGGSENYHAIIEWAAENLNDAEIEAVLQSAG